MTLHVFLVEDGATHYVIANHPGEAIEVLALSNGQTRANYCEEEPNHTIRRMEPTERVVIWLDMSRPTIPEGLGVPPSASISVRASATCAEWITTHPNPGVLCSTEW